MTPITKMKNRWLTLREVHLPERLWQMVDIGMKRLIKVSFVGADNTGATHVLWENWQDKECTGEDVAFVTEGNSSLEAKTDGTIRLLDSNEGDRNLK